MSIIVYHKGVLYADSVALIDGNAFEVQKLYHNDYVALATVGELYASHEAEQIIEFLTSQLKNTGEFDFNAAFKLILKDGYVSTTCIVMTKGSVYAVNINSSPSNTGPYDQGMMLSSPPETNQRVNAYAIPLTGTLINGSCVGYIQLALRLGHDVIDAVAKTKPYTTLNGPITHTVAMTALRGIDVTL